MRTAVVFWLIIPMAASSAMMADSVAAVVSPGTAIISNPTEQTQVIASSFSKDSAPMRAASITGMNAPLSPPTWLEAITPPFLTASFNSARAAVVPGAPAISRPISVRIWATLSPMAGVGANDRSTMPKGTPKRCDARRATSWPTRVMRKAVRLMVSATVSKG